MRIFQHDGICPQRCGGPLILIDGDDLISKNKIEKNTNCIDPFLHREVNGQEPTKVENVSGTQINEFWLDFQGRLGNENYTIYIMNNIGSGGFAYRINRCDEVKQYIPDKGIFEITEIYQRHDASINDSGLKAIIYEEPHETVSFYCVVCHAAVTLRLAARKQKNHLLTKKHQNNFKRLKQIITKGHEFLGGVMPNFFNLMPSPPEAVIPIEVFVDSESD